MRTSTLCAAACLALAFSVLPGAAAASSSSSTAPTDPHNPADVESAVRQYFSGVPAMADIARCESGFRQFDSSGGVLFDPSYSMIGVFQISSMHLPQALGMNMDLMTLGGNLAYAKYLYDEQGTSPWLSSYGCWGSAEQTPPTNATANQPAPSGAGSVPLGSTLVLGMTASAVMQVQQMLNEAGFALADAGPGSPGNETSMFGSLTRAAVRKFQCAMNLVCSGDEGSTGFGAVDSKTYSALLAAAAGAGSHAQAATSTSATSSSSDKAAEIADVESQIQSLTAQLNTLNERLAELTK